MVCRVLGLIANGFLVFGLYQRSHIGRLWLRNRPRVRLKFRTTHGVACKALPNCSTSKQWRLPTISIGSGWRSEKGLRKKRSNALIRG